MDLKETSILGERVDQHWYYASKGRAMLQLLRNRLFRSVADIGSGSGFFTKLLLRETSVEDGICIDTGYLSESVVEVNHKKVQFIRHVNTLKSDLVLMMDVLEHVADDIEFLSNWVKVAPDGAHFLISVPAFQFLYSDHDRFLEHYRRYNRKQLMACVESAGLRVKDCTFYFGSLFPVVAASRLISRLSSTLFPRHKNQSQLRRHSVPINKLLKWIHARELYLLPFNRYAGLTLFCLAQKPDSRIGSEK